MKNCANCENWNRSVFRPHCNCYVVAIKSDACGSLYPVTQCMKHEEYRAMLAQHAAEHPAPRSLASRLLSMFPLKVVSTSNPYLAGIVPERKDAS